MIDFPALVEGLFILLMLALAIATVIVFRKPVTKKRLPQEQRALVLFLVLAGIFLLTVLLGSKLNSWKNSYRKQRSEQALHQKLNQNEYKFVERSFGPLGKAYKKLEASGAGLDKMIKKISQLIPQHPNHKVLLDDMLRSFREARQQQAKLYKSANLEIRNAMLLAGTTQDELSVHNRFHNKAAVLYKQIVDFDNNVKKKLNNAAWLLEGDLKEARKQLNQAVATLHRMKRKKKTAVSVYNFSTPPQTEPQLLQFLAQSDPDSKQVLNAIAEQIIQSQQSKDTLLDLLNREKELAEPIKKTLKLWDNAETQGLYYWGMLLYAIESSYLADQFNMPHHNRAYAALARDLKKQAPVFLAEIRQTNQDAKSSFFPLNNTSK